jgi:hypothetical protein
VAEPEQDNFEVLNVDYSKIMSNNKSDNKSGAGNGPLQRGTSQIEINASINSLIRKANAKGREEAKATKEKREVVFAKQAKQMDDYKKQLAYQAQPV